MQHPDAESIFPNTDQENVENLLSFEQSPAMNQAPTQELDQNDQTDQLQVGMVLLPDTLDIDPDLEEFIERNGINQW
jgi:hypothetical protein